MLLFVVKSEWVLVTYCTGIYDSFLQYITTRVRKMNWICQKLCKNLFHGSDRSEEAARSTGNSLQSEEKAVLTEIPRIGISI